MREGGRTELNIIHVYIGCMHLYAYRSTYYVHEYVSIAECGNMKSGQQGRRRVRSNADEKGRVMGYEGLKCCTEFCRYFFPH